MYCWASTSDLHCIVVLRMLLCPGPTSPSTTAPPSCCCALAQPHHLLQIPALAAPIMTACRFPLPDLPADWCCLSVEGLFVIRRHTAVYRSLIIISIVLLASTSTIVPTSSSFLACSVTVAFRHQGMWRVTVCGGVKSQTRTEVDSCVNHGLISHMRLGM